MYTSGDLIRILHGIEILGLCYIAYCFIKDYNKKE
jgi:hypothetical protein